MAEQASYSPKKANVFIRVRPLLQREVDAKERVNWYADDQSIQQYKPGTKNVLSTSTPYAFDQVFGETATNENVYDTAVAPIVEKSLQGFNGTVICYGQTSSGKTHTMWSGSDDDPMPGIIMGTVQDLFWRFRDVSRSCFMKIGLVGLNNEKLTDLLHPQKKQIDIKEVNGEAVLKDLKEIDVFTHRDVYDAALRVAKQKGIWEETRKNKESSGAHTILRIMIHSTPKNDSQDCQVTKALLNFVDLAGSDKADQSGAVGDGFREATHVDKSLTTLCTVVNQLSGAKQPTKKPSKQSLVSYGDSKLTQILQGSLSGNAYIALICSVSPASLEETHSTLRFASNAKCIKVDPTKNLGPVTAREYRQKILDLETQLNKKTQEVINLSIQLDAFKRFVRLEESEEALPEESLATTDNGSLETAAVTESLATANESLATAKETRRRLQQLERRHEALQTEVAQLRQDNQDNR